MELKQERQKLLNSIVYPTLFILLLWFIHGIQVYENLSFAPYGLNPRVWSGLLGIITAPLIHHDWEHLISNTMPTWFLLSGLCYYYQNKSLPIFLFIYFASGIWAWVFARSAYHIGASGLVYGLIFFLIVSALIKRERKMMFFSFLIIFLYGSVIWGFFPEFFPGKNISWECHLTGALAGIVAAFYFKKDGPQSPEFPQDDDDNENNTDDPPYWMVDTKNETDKTL